MARLPARIALLSGLLAMMAGASPAAAAPIVFSEVAGALGVDFTWSDRWLYGDLGAGVALEDVDGDGNLDLVFATKAGEPLRVYLRQADGRYADASAQFGLSADVDHKQVLFADLDDDGQRELILSCWIPAGDSAFSGGRVEIFAHSAGGGFATPPVTISTGSGLPTGIAAGDLDRDGDLDLYVSVWKSGAPDATSANLLLRNDGGLQFVDVASALGVADTKKSYQCVIHDLNADQWPDIVVAEDKKGGVTYFESDGAGGFVDRSAASGLDGYLALTRDYVDGMGVAVGDADNDGLEDVYVTNVFDGNVFYHNRGGGVFDEVAAANGTVSYRVAWGCGFADFDLDGWRDLYVVDFGAGSPDTADRLDRVYHNLGNGDFEDVGPTAGVNLPDDGFGMACGDLDADGDLDVVVVNGDAPVRIYRNDTVGGHWVQVALRGTSSARDAIGARVEVLAGGITQIQTRGAGNSYLSQDSPALEFGLGVATEIERIRVTWPSGQIADYGPLSVDARYEFVEGAVPALVAPRPSLRATETGVELRWNVDPSLRYDRFEIWRFAAGREERIGLLAADSPTGTYAFSDLSAPEEATYYLVARVGKLSLRGEGVLHRAPDRMRLRVAAAVPNPFNPRTRLRAYLPPARHRRLLIVDAAGRRVRAFDAPAGPGWIEVEWDGLDAGGRPVASGSYRFVAEADGQRRSTPLTLVR